MENERSGQLEWKRGQAPMEKSLGVNSVQKMHCGGTPPWDEYYSIDKERARDASQVHVVVLYQHLKEFCSHSPLPQEEGFMHLFCLSSKISVNIEPAKKGSDAFLELESATATIHNII